MNELNLEYLSHQDFFSELNSDQIKRVAECVSLKEYHLGKVIFQSGEIIKSMIIIISGNLEQSSLHNLEDNKLLKTLSQKEQFGVESLYKFNVSKYQLKVSSKELIILEIDPLLLQELCKLKENEDILNIFDNYRILKTCQKTLSLIYYHLELNEKFTKLPLNKDIYLLEGKLILKNDDKVITISRGDTLSFDILKQYQWLFAQESSKFCFFSNNKLANKEKPIIEAIKPLNNKAIKEEEAVNIRVKKAFPHHFQRNYNDCGETCLLMICDYYYTYPSNIYLTSMLNKTQAGCSLENLLSCAKSLGFSSESLFLTFEDLKQIKEPCIVNWNSTHWVVLYKYQDGKYFIADPALGKLSFVEEDFQKECSQYTLKLSPSRCFPNFNDRASTSSHYIKYLRPFFSQISIIILASLVIQLLSLSIPLFAKFIVDIVIIEQNLEWLDLIFCFVILLLISQTILEFLRFKLVSHFGMRVKLSIIKDFYTQLLALPLKYFDRHKSGDILTRLYESDRISRFLTQDGLQIFLDGISTTLYLILMFHFSWQLSCIILFMIALNVLFIKLIRPYMNMINTEIFQKTSEVQSFTIEILNGFKTIKTMNLQNIIRWRWENLQVRFYNSYLKGLNYSIIASNTANFMHHFLNLLIVLIGFQFVMYQKITVGELLAFSIMSATLNKNLLSLIENWDELEVTFSAMERVQDIFDSSIEVVGDLDKIEVQKFRGNIHIENLSFRYDNAPDINVLQNFNIEISAGEKIALVGRSGSGKSTLFSLMSALYPLSTGTIYYDGFEVSDINLKSLRKQIFNVSQDSFVFKGTIKECITKNTVLVSMDQIIKAAKLSACHDFIVDLPKAYDTFIDSSASNLSRGQKQRLILANLFLQKPAIILLDEIFSAIDSDTEKTILQNIFKEFKDQTILLSTHKLEISKSFDKVLVLDSGHVREFDHYEKLLENNDLYYYLSNQYINLD
ncbi:MAG: hypothetical protein COB02_07465 [Candidatus Cloacimonadota bacterium]|nr:MAG: hypothetical protein COB02_07465 [Candidatus Cloacimonadota bacterium]